MDAYKQTKTYQELDDVEKCIIDDSTLYPNSFLRQRIRQLLIVINAMPARISATMLEHEDAERTIAECDALTDQHRHELEEERTAHKCQHSKLHRKMKLLRKTQPLDEVEIARTSTSIDASNEKARLISAKGVERIAHVRDRLAMARRVYGATLSEREEHHRRWATCKYFHKRYSFVLNTRLRFAEELAVVDENVAAAVAVPRKRKRVQPSAAVAAEPLPVVSVENNDINDSAVVDVDESVAEEPAMNELGVEVDVVAANMDVNKSDIASQNENEVDSDDASLCHDQRQEIMAMSRDRDTQLSSRAHFGGKQLHLLQKLPYKKYDDDDDDDTEDSEDSEDEDAEESEDEDDTHLGNFVTTSDPVRSITNVCSTCGQVGHSAIACTMALRDQIDALLAKDKKNEQRITQILHTIESFKEKIVYLENRL